MPTRRPPAPFLLLWTAAFAAGALSARALPIAGRYPSRLVVAEKPNQLEAETLARINKARRTRRLNPLIRDPRLSAVAREHSEDMAAHNYFDYVSPRLGTLDYRRHRAGSSAANARYAIYRNTSVNKLMLQIAKGPDPIHLSPATHVGMGIVRKGLLRDLFVTLILSDIHSTLDPFPTMPQDGKSYRLAATIEKGFSQPRLIITLPDGSVVDRELHLSAMRTVTATVDFDKGRGKYMVEITATGALGPVVLDLMNCYAGVPYPAPQARAPLGKPPENLRRAEQQMLEMINQERAQAGLKKLRFDERLADVARGHSSDMVRNKFFAHVSPTHGDLAARMKRARLKASSFTENLAANRTLQGAHEGLMNSPGHRKNILDPLVDRVGIGIARNLDETITVTQNFARDFVNFDTTALERAFLDAVNEARGKKYLSRLTTDADLTRIALENSTSMGRKNALSHARATELLRAAKLPYAVQMRVAKSVAPPKTEQIPALLEKKARRVGIAIVQTSRNGEKPLWITVLVAE